MDINIRNVIGAIGLVLVLFNGRAILSCARELNPLNLIEPLQVSGDPWRLTVLGALIVGVLLILRYGTRR